MISNLTYIYLKSYEIVISKIFQSSQNIFSCFGFLTKKPRNIGHFLRKIEFWLLWF